MKMGPRMKSRRWRSQEEDRSTQSGREVASSGVSAAAPAGSPGTSVAMAMVRGGVVEQDPVERAG